MHITHITLYLTGNLNPLTIPIADRNNEDGCAERIERVMDSLGVLRLYSDDGLNWHLTRPAAKAAGCKVNRVRRVNGAHIIAFDSFRDG